MNTDHAYATLSPDEIEELFSQFLLNSWSFSKLMSFARNEKAFEMSYIYRYKTKMSATTIAGQAYHEALEVYFLNKKEGNELDLATLEMKAFEYIEEVPSYDWKLQKTTPSIESCKEKALKVVNQLLKNFMAEKALYEDDIAEILGVEERFNEWLVVNGVDIPLPANAKLDLRYLSVRNTIVVLDHKTKASFTDEKELELAMGKQSITYVLTSEAATGEKVDEVKFVENKYSINKDGSPQLRATTVAIDDDTRRLYESMLYEPLKRFLEAVSDPDYVYLINENDNLTDKAELYEFWMKTMIAEVDDFNIPENKKELISKRLKKVRDSSLATINPTVIKNFQEHASNFITYDLSNKNMSASQKIEHTLRSFSIVCTVAHVLEGYSSNTYLLELQAGTNMTKPFRHRLDIASALNVPNVRMKPELMMYEGKSYLAIESSKKREKDLLFDAKYLEGMKIPIGIDNLNQLIVWDLENHSTPHMLICGQTGSGKSVSIKSTIEYARLAGVERIVIMDPKFEFTEYHADRQIEVYNEILEIELQMAHLVKEMNAMVKAGKTQKTLIVFDEFADAVSAARSGNALKVYEDQQQGFFANGMPKFKKIHTDTLKSLEENLKIILQKGRSSGFRVISATQRASTKVITGDAKVNFPVQVCFRVNKEIDSKVVIDEGGAEALAGAGDGLMKSPQYSDVVRFQGFYKPDSSVMQDAV